MKTARQIQDFRAEMNKMTVNNHVSRTVSVLKILLYAIQGRQLVRLISQDLGPVIT
jgi:hypothetical protein